MEETGKDIKKWMKDSPIENIISMVGTAGMEFMAENRLTEEEFKLYKSIAVTEIKKRLRLSRQKPPRA